MWLHVALQHQPDVVGQPSTNSRDKYSGSRLALRAISFAEEYAVDKGGRITKEASF